MDEKIQNIFRQVLNDDTIELRDELSENDVPKWNSLNNVLLINKIEESFEVKFDLSEVLKIKNVGDIKKLLADKLNG